MNELIVEFARSTEEDDARALVTSLGATVRRRMRGDDASHLMLLVRVPSDAVAAALAAHPRVGRVERNGRDFGAS